MDELLASLEEFAHSSDYAAEKAKELGEFIIVHADEIAALY